MTDTGNPQEPQYYPYPDGPAHPPPAGQAGGSGLSALLGDRLVHRPQPRLGVSLAGTGVVLALAGAIAWGGDFLTSGGGGAARRLLGVALSLAVVAAGYVIAVRRQRGPLVTAGVAASAFGVPVVLGFLTYTTDPGHSGLPFSLDAVVLVSVLAWMATYVRVPGARGHSIYLGLAVVALWLYVLDKAEPGLFSVTTLVRGFGVSGYESVFPARTAPPDWTTVATLSLLFGLAYYLAAFLLDHAGRTGPGAALVVGGFLATAAGIGAAAVTLHALGTGLLLIAVGLAVAGAAARGERRFTTWVWSAGVGLGMFEIIGKVAPDNNAAAGVLLITAGAVVVLAGHLVAAAGRERDDMASGEQITRHEYQREANWDRQTPTAL